MATSVLRSGETIKYITKRSLWSYWLHILISLFLLQFLIGVLGLVWVYLSWKTTDIVVTDNRILYQTGVFNTDMISLDLHRIESVQVHRSLLGRMVNYGTIAISGAGNPTVTVVDIYSPSVFIGIVDSMRG